MYDIGFYWASVAGNFFLVQSSSKAIWSQADGVLKVGRVSLSFCLRSEVLVRRATIMIFMAVDVVLERWFKFEPSHVTFSVNFVAISVKMKGSNANRLRLIGLF